MPSALGDRRGFTLTELLVVVAIIVLLTSIVVPNILGRIDVAKMHTAENQIAEIEAALAAYYADFGTYPGDVYPTEDLNNNGKLDWEDHNNDGVVDPGESEDQGVDIDNDHVTVGDGNLDYACNSDGTEYANGRLDAGDGVINILDLEWALKTTAKNGPYMKEIPRDPWGNRYVYYAPYRRTWNAQDYLYIDPDTMRNEDTLVRTNGRLDGDTTPRNGVPDATTEPVAGQEDRGIGQYATTNANVETNFTNKWAGRDNGILDHGDDDNKDGSIQAYLVIDSSPAPQEIQPHEWGNADVSPDGLARNMGYYIYSVGRNKQDETATGYEDIGGFATGEPDNILNSDLTGSGGADARLYVYLPADGGSSQFDEDLDGDGTLDTGYEDTGIMGMPGRMSRGEGDWNTAENPTITDPDPDGQPDEEFGTKDTTIGGPTTWHYNTHHTPGERKIGHRSSGFDIGGDDINSWNNNRPWREHPSYGGS